MYNESTKKATMKYLKTQKQIRFWVNPDLFSQIKAAAADAGFGSLRQFYLYAISNLMLEIKNGFKLSDVVNIDLTGKETVADDAEIE